MHIQICLDIHTASCQVQQCQRIFPLKINGFLKASTYHRSRDLANERKFVATSVIVPLTSVVNSDAVFSFAIPFFRRLSHCPVSVVNRRSISENKASFGVSIQPNPVGIFVRCTRYDFAIGKNSFYLNVYSVGYCTVKVKY